jgi:hypothetical protein
MDDNSLLIGLIEGVPVLVLLVYIVSYLKKENNNLRIKLEKKELEIRDLEKKNLSILIKVSTILDKITK